MSLSKKVRFNVFKRDSFTCCYCGKRPPMVILEVDHILAVSNGGTDDMHNLVSSCFDCNRGKSNIPLGERTEALAEQQKVEQERHEQVKRYNRWLKSVDKQKEKTVREISDFWVVLMGSDPEKYVISGRLKRNIKMFLKFLPPKEIMDSLDIAHDVVGFGLGGNFERSLKYFCGICWKKIKGETGRK